jgi:uncharacterized protein YuzB (UPF0349 family)
MERWRSAYSLLRRQLPRETDMKIRFCEKNKGKGKVYRQLKEEFPEYNIKIKDCIKQCGTCGEKPMATVDKEKISSKEGDDLYKKIVEKIKKK